MRGAVLLMLSLIVGPLAACSSAPSSRSTSPPPPDRPGSTYFAAADRAVLPALSGATLTGDRLSLGDLTRSGVVVINVWASWCTECRAESRGLAMLSRQLRSQHVRFIGIDEQDQTARARRFASAEGTRYPSLVDSDGALLSKLTLLPSTGIPSTLVVDGQGRMAGRIVGTARVNALRSLIAQVSASN